MYMPLSQTLRAIEGLGSNIDRMSALDLARKQAANDHAVRMAQLGLQRQQTENQGIVGAINAQAEAAYRKSMQDYQAADLAEKQKQTEKENAYYDRMMKKQQADEEYQAKMKTSGIFGDLYSQILSESGVPENEKPKMLAYMKASVGPMIWAKPTNRERMGNIIDKMEEMSIQAHLRSLSGRGGSGGSGGSGGTGGREEQSAMNATIMTNAFKLADAVMSGQVPPDQAEKAFKTFERYGVRFNAAKGMVEDGKGGTMPGVIYTPYTVSPEEAKTMEVQEADLQLSKYPGYKNMPTGPQKAAVVAKYMYTRDYGAPEDMQRFEAESGLNIVNTAGFGKQWNEDMRKRVGGKKENTGTENANVKSAWTPPAGIPGTGITPAQVIYEVPEAAKQVFKPVGNYLGTVGGAIKGVASSAIKPNPYFTPDVVAPVMPATFEEQYGDKFQYPLGKKWATQKINPLAGRIY